MKTLSKKLLEPSIALGFSVILGILALIITQSSWAEDSPLLKDGKFRGDMVMVFKKTGDPKWNSYQYLATPNVQTLYVQCDRERSSCTDCLATGSLGVNAGISCALACEDNFVSCMATGAPSLATPSPTPNSQKETECNTLKSKCNLNYCSGKNKGEPWCLKICEEGEGICAGTIEANNAPEILKLNQQEKSLYLQLSRKEKGRAWIAIRFQQHEEFVRLMTELLQGKGSDVQKKIDELKKGN